MHHHNLMLQHSKQTMLQAHLLRQVMLVLGTILLMVSQPLEALPQVELQQLTQRALQAAFRTKSMP